MRARFWRANEWKRLWILENEWACVFPMAQQSLHWDGHLNPCIDTLSFWTDACFGAFPVFSKQTLCNSYSWIWTTSSFAIFTGEHIKWTEFIQKRRRRLRLCARYYCVLKRAADGCRWALWKVIRQLVSEGC